MEAPFFSIGGDLAEAEAHFCGFCSGLECVFFLERNVEDDGFVQFVVSLNKPFWECRG